MHIESIFYGDAAVYSNVLRPTCISNSEQTVPKDPRGVWMPHAVQAELKVFCPKSIQCFIYQK